jgi:hypothetical protein
MSPKLSIGVLETRRDAKLRKLAGAGPMIQGSLTRIGVTCGNPNCKCARGEKHVSHILTKKVRGKSRSLYVPVDMVETVRKWVEEHKRVKRLLKEVSELNEKIIRAHVPTKRAKAKNRAAAERVRSRS